MDHIDLPTLRPPLHNSAQPRDKEPDELVKILEWQQKRLERRIRGDYESAIVHLSHLINSNLDSPARIAAIRIEGAHRTRRSFLSFLVSPFLVQDPEKPADLQTTLQTARHVAYILNKTDIFSNVAVQVDKARDPIADSNDVDLVFTTRERGRLYLNSSTELGNNEGNASATGRIRNVFGGAETVEANVSFGTKTRRSFRASLTAPISRDLGTTAEISTYGLERDLTSYASCFEGLRGVRAVIRSGFPAWGIHEFAYEGVVRHLASLTPTASLSIREAAGFSSKSSLSHTYVLDTRHDKVLNTRPDRLSALASAPGTYLKIFQELAGVRGLGGDAKFYKGEVEAKAGFGITEGVTLSLAARSGLLWGLSGSKGTLFSDRFQLGGSTSVRGFMMNGMGPHDGNDSIGGDAYWSLGASIISDIPKKPSWPVKLHTWVNTGRLEGINRSLPPKDSLDTLKSSLFKTPSLSAGLGLIYRFDPIRVELNFGMPLVSSAGERGKRGVQVGMGLEFM
ncbi:SAM50-like protein SPAC17C9.06 [Leucoagaricus sp. SymC.cos]|nr:SAM50-like protein SPAC17C9.06 [Leucoagaricus sp. SymC.cos]